MNAGGFTHMGLQGLAPGGLQGLAPAFNVALNIDDLPADRIDTANNLYTFRVKVPSHVVGSSVRLTPIGIFSKAGAVAISVPVGLVAKAMGGFGNQLASGSWLRDTNSSSPADALLYVFGYIAQGTSTPAANAAVYLQYNSLAPELVINNIMDSSFTITLQLINMTTQAPLTSVVTDLVVVLRGQA